MSRLDEIEAQVRQKDLLTRLEECQLRIGNMCKEHRGPKMSIPVSPDDDDFFICITLRDAAHYVKTVEGALV